MSRKPQDHSSVISQLPGTDTEVLMIAAPESDGLNPVFVEQEFFGILD